MTRLRLLVTVAHPDDEAFGCGGVLGHAADNHVETVVVCARRGELGEPAPGSGIQRSELGLVREAELRASCAALGVGRVDLLGWRDSGLDGEPEDGSLAAAPLEAVAAAVVEVVDSVRPDVIVTLDDSDGHRDAYRLS
jgi:LmbE family N-acetylglucosaminyl deacetylase